MMNKVSHLARIQAFGFVMAFFAAAFFVGCSENEQKSEPGCKAKTTAKPCEKSAQATGQSVSPTPKAQPQAQAQAQPQRKPQAVAHASPTKAPQVATNKPAVEVQRQATPVQKANEVSPTAQNRTAAPVANDPDKLRAQTEDMIYATIRIRMEEMAAERARLLESGKTQSDPEVRQLESSILVAQRLLRENGEIVDELDPPIQQQNPQ